LPRWHMSLFTSNFKNEARVLATVMTCLLATEAGVRVALPRMSTDWRNFQAVTGRAGAQRTARDARVLFLGNSLTKQGISSPLMEARIGDALGARLQIDKFATDDSNVTEWFYMIRGMMAMPGDRPDLLVISYAEDQLSDRAPVHADRLASYYGGLRI